MKITLLVLLLLSLTSTFSKKNELDKDEDIKQTMVTFVVQENSQEEKQIIKLNLKLSKSDPSLADAIQKAQQLQSKIRDMFYQFCVHWNNLEDSQSVQDCQQQIQSSQYQIKAQYYYLRGKQLFKTFIVQFQVTIKIINAAHIGDLIDQFADMINDGDIIMSGISWEGVSQDTNQQQIIEKGIEKGKLACNKIKMQMYRIKSIDFWQKPQPQKKKQQKPQEGQQQQQEQEEQEQPEEEQGQEQQQKQKYKFVVVCRSRPTPKKKLSIKSLLQKKNKVRSQN